jgi:DNA repair photolyase
MKLNIVKVPSIKQPITQSPGFHKKELSDYKLDACALCGFGCRYCSSNFGNYLRINRKRFANLTEQQIGERLLPAEDPSLMFVWPDYLDRLSDQLSHKRPDWGTGQTMVYSMLTDGFAPELVKTGVTESSLRLVLEQTGFRIRALTKNSIVGTSRWTRLFREHHDRFIVGLSIGTSDDQWAKRVEVGTPSPTSRLAALRKVQDAGIQTYGMLCPVFPDVLENNQPEKLVDQIRPELVEHVWAEPYNDRQNWRAVRSGYQRDSYGYRWLTDVYEHGRKDLWSRYATDLYVRLRDKARREGWLHKLRYLLYEDQITKEDSRQFKGLHGVLLQSKPGDDGRSRNPWFAALQR